MRIPAVLYFYRSACALMASVALLGPTQIVAKSTAEKTTVYVGGTLIDGTGKSPVTNSAIVVRGEKIVIVGKRGEVDFPSHAKVVDLSGKWVVPGLIDAHTHFFESGRIFTSPGRIDLQNLVSYQQEAEWVTARLPYTLASYVCSGVLTSVSLGGPQIELDAKKIAANAEPGHAPDVFVAIGPTLQYEPEPYPRFLGERIGVPAFNRAEADELVRLGALEGKSLIKTVFMGAPGEDLAKTVAMNVEFVDIGRQKNIRITTHVMGLDASKKLAAVGVDSLQHSIVDAEVDAEFIKILQDNGTIYVPTLDMYHRGLQVLSGKVQLEKVEKTCGDPEVIKSWSFIDQLPAEKRQASNGDALLSRGAASLRNMRSLVAAGGIDFATGSDSGNIGLLHGASLHYEIKLMSLTGISNLDLIKAATLNSARVAGIEDKLGSIEVGKQADFLVLENDPLVDITNLQDIDKIVKKGRMITRKEILFFMDKLATKMTK